MQRAFGSKKRDAAALGHCRFGRPKEHVIRRFLIGGMARGCVFHRPTFAWEKKGEAQRARAGPKRPAEGVVGLTKSQEWWP